MAYNKRRDPYWRGIYTAADRIENEQRARGIGEGARRAKLENTILCPNCYGSGRAGNSKCYACNGSGRAPFGTTQQRAKAKHDAIACSKDYGTWRKTRW